MKTKLLATLLILNSIHLYGDEDPGMGERIVDGVNNAVSGIRDGAVNVFSESVERLSWIDSSIDGLNLGVTLLGSKTDSNGDYEIDGAVFVNYSGYENRGLFPEDYKFDLVPTTLSVTVDGKRVKVYTELATLQYLGEDDLEILVSAVSLKYRKNKDLLIEKNSELSFMELSAIKYFPLDDSEVSGLEMFIRGDIGLGGKSRVKTFVNGIGTIESEDTTYGRVALETGINIPITAEIPGDDFFGSGADLYLYGGRSRQWGENTTIDQTYIGLELYTGKISSEVTYTPYIDYVRQEVEFGNRFSGRAEDSIVNFGIRVNW